MMRLTSCRFLLFLLIGSGVLTAQQISGGGGQGPHSAASLFRELRAVTLDGSRLYWVREANLEREDLHITLNRGVLAFSQAIDGRVTGAYFEGEGELLLAPPDRVERSSLGMFTGAAILDERFTSAYLRFNDAVPAELEAALRPLRSAGSVAAAGKANDAEADVEAEEDESIDPGAFVARGNGVFSQLSSMGTLRLVYTMVNAEHALQGGSIRWEPQVDDHYLHVRFAGQKLGIFDVVYDSLTSEQIAVGQAGVRNGAAYFNVWTSFPVRSARMKVSATKAGAEPTPTVQTQTAAEAMIDPVEILRQELKVRVRPPREMEAEANLTLRTSKPGMRMIVFELSRFLQVKEVTADGRPLEFLQNEALAGSELARRGNDAVAIVFPAAAEPGKKFGLRFVYRGEVISDFGDGLLYVGARGIWYPNRGVAMTAFDLEFRYPAGWTLVATGKRVAPAGPASNPDAEPGEQMVHYVSERPIPFAGFNLGRWMRAEAKAGSVLVEAYASPHVERSAGSSGEPVFEIEADSPEFGPRRLGRQTPGIMRVVPAPRAQPSEHVKKVAQTTAETIDYLAARLGPFPYSSLALTQIPGRVSQGWPGMIYLASLAFLDPEERARLKVGSYDELLFSRLMTAHETAHQWWGDLLFWKSYREQWLVEALSNYSVLMMIEERDPAAFRQLMEHYRKDLLAKNHDGRLTLEAGPVTLGTRLDSSEFPNAYDTISYGRGTWLFHMLRHMLLDGSAVERQAKLKIAKHGGSAAGDPGKHESSEDPFFAVLAGLRQRFEGKEINTRDVQEAFEEALPESLRYEGHKSLEWFFDEWVNGTAVPALTLEGIRLTRTGAGVTASGKIVQKKAPKDLVSCVPLYAETAGKKLVLLGRVFADGEETAFHLKAPPGTVRVVLDPYQTVLTRE